MIYIIVYCVVYDVYMIELLVYDLCIIYIDLFFVTECII